MNFESIKSGFLSYLQEKLGEDANFSKNEGIQNSAVSIFMYSNEFKDYLVEEVGADVSIFSKSINEIMSMDFVNGKLVEKSKQETNSDSFESETSQNDETNLMTYLMNDLFTDETVINTLDVDGSGELDSTEMTNFITGVASVSENGDEITFDNLAESVQSIQDGSYTPVSESNNNILNRLLERVYENKTVIKTLDLDGDGELNAEEKAKFEEFIKGYDGNGDELTESDIKRAFDDIIDGNFSYDNNLEEKSKEIDKSTEAELEERAANTKEAGQTSPVQGNSGASSSSGGSFNGTAGSSNSFSNSNTPLTIDNMSLEQLEKEKETKQGELQDAKDAVNDVYSGKNEAVKEAEDANISAEKDLDELFDQESDEVIKLKADRDEIKGRLDKQQGKIDDCKTNINKKENEITDKKSLIADDESNISALESALAALPSPDPEKGNEAEIAEKKAKLEQEIRDAKQLKTDHENELKDLEKELDGEDGLKAQLKEAEDAKTGIETELQNKEQEILDKCSPQKKQAIQDTMQRCKETRIAIETAKNSQVEAAKEQVSIVQGELDDINDKIRDKKAEQTKKDYSVSDFDFDFDLKLSDRQQGELDAFNKNWEQNKDKYEAVEKATGMPAELVAAIHWREGSGNFNTYLHNGQQLGTTTTIVPKGIYFDNWTDAAIDAVTNYGTSISSIDPNNIDTWYNYAEHYNGMGYHNKGLPSPYVWAGTSNYNSGKYVADGKFDPNYVDQQLGVAVMLQSLLS